MRRVLMVMAGVLLAGFGPAALGAEGGFDCSDYPEGMQAQCVVCENAGRFNGDVCLCESFYNQFFVNTGQCVQFINQAILRAPACDDSLREWSGEQGVTPQELPFTDRECGGQDPQG